MHRKTPEEHFQDYYDSAIISILLPLLIAGPYQASQSVPVGRLGLTSLIPYWLIAFLFFVIFASGLAGSVIRGGFIGGIGYLVGNYGANILVTNPTSSLLIMGFGASVTYIGTRNRTRAVFKNELNQILKHIGM